MLLSSFNYTAHCRESTNDLSNVHTVFEESQTQSHWFSKNYWFTEMLVNNTQYRTHGGPGWCGRYSDSLRAKSPGIESPWGRRRDISHPSRPALGSTQPSEQRVVGLFSGIKHDADPPPRPSAEVIVWNYRILPLPLWIFTTCYRVKMVKQSRYRPGVAQRVPGS